MSILWEYFVRMESGGVFILRYLSWITHFINYTSQFPRHFFKKNCVLIWNFVTNLWHSFMCFPKVRRLCVLNSLLKMASSVADVVCIKQITFKIKNKKLSSYKKCEKFFLKPFKKFLKKVKNARRFDVSTFLDVIIK